MWLPLPTATEVPAVLAPPSRLYQVPAWPPTMPEPASFGVSVTVTAWSCQPVGALSVVTGGVVSMMHLAGAWSGPGCR